MAFKLTKAEDAHRAKLLADLEEKWGEVSTARDEADGAYQKATEELNDALARYNELVAEAEQFRGEVADRLREEFDGKSEAWQEGDKGSEAGEMVSAWEDTSFDEVPQIDIPTIDLPDGADVAGELEEFPTEVG